MVFHYSHGISKPTALPVCEIVNVGLTVLLADVLTML